MIKKYDNEFQNFENMIKLKYDKKNSIAKI